MRLWRVVKAKHARDALNGEGARLYGGRWNERGTSIVYLSETLSLAALETFVHLGPNDSRIPFSAIPVDPPEGIALDVLPANQLPPNWRAEPPPSETKQIGTAWARNGATLLLSVPSIIIPGERNFLVNPRHSDFAKLTIGSPIPFGFDGRMWK